MKKNKFVAILLLFLSVQFSIAQDIMELEHFDQINATGLIEITLQEGDTEKLELITHNFDRDDVKVRVEEGILRINVMKSLIKDSSIEILLTYKELRKIKVNAGARAIAKNTISIDKLELKANSGAEIELKIEVNNLQARLAEGAQIKLSGTTASQTITASSGAIYYGHDLECDYTYVNANTGGRAEVIANVQIEAAANTGGQIEYKGEPGVIKQKDWLGGGVENF